MSRDRIESERAPRADERLGRPPVLGLGNASRGDDAIGLEVARRLARRGVAVAEAYEPFAVLEWLEDPCRDGVSIIVDAMVSGAPPGTLRCFDATARPLPDGAFPLSTHDLGLAEMIELARALDRLAPHVLVVGVEAEHFEAGAQLSPAVARAASAAAGEIERLLASRG